MAILFHASTLEISEEDWGIRILLSADETLDAERYLTIQRKDTFSDQDVRLQMDDVYIETCGQGWSWYGHIDSFELFDTRIRVQLDEEAARRIGDDGAIEVSFDPADEKHAALRAALRRAFVGRAYYSDRAT
jgi:hypothetical protein